MRIIVLLLLSGSAFASGPSVEVEQNQNLTTTAGGSTTKAFSVSGGDMDINQCLATHSVIFGLWQGTHLNRMCAANGLDANGKHKEAAEMRCSVRAFRKVYGLDCVQKTMLRPPPPPLPVVVPTSGPQIKEIIVAHEKAEAQEWGEIGKRLARIESGQRIASQKAQQRRDYAQQTMEKLENDPEE
jgi:hypothetical protein